MIIAKPKFMPPPASFVSLFHYHFMQNAIIAGTIVAIVAGLVGYFMVIRSQSFAGHSLASVGFAGATGAVLLGVSPLLGLIVSGIIAGAGIHAFEMAGRSSKHNDVAIGAVFTASLALGFLFVHLSNLQSNSIYNVLFGNILGISNSEVLITLILDIFALMVVILIARPLLFASIDPVVAGARGVPVGLLGLCFLIILGLVVSVAVEVMGVLLIFALLVTPAAAARQLSSNPVVAIGLAVAIGVVCTWLGLIAGYYTPLPVSFFITTFAFASYVIARVSKGMPRAALPFRKFGKITHGGDVGSHDA